MPQPKPRDPSRGPQAADPSSTCRQETGGWIRSQGIRRKAADNAATLRALDLDPVSERRAGAEKVRRVARRDSDQFGVSAGTHCRQTPKPARAVVRLHRTTDPPRAHLWPTFLCEEKGRSLAGRREKRLTSLALAIRKRASGENQVKMDPRVRETAKAGCRSEHPCCGWPGGREKDFARHDEVSGVSSLAIAEK